jgi:serine/threonine protein kinase/Flp pilus assembly protein TadD
MNERSLFLAVLDIEDPSERSAYLDRACAGDPALRAQVEQLLKAHQASGLFMERPAIALGATGDEPIRERPGTVIGPYKLMEQIGEGGMGLVFVAEQQQPVRRRVALKVIKPGMDSRQVVARFEAERQALAMMDHANIAKVHDGGTTPDGRPYFVMELVKGTPITDYCDQHRLPTRQRLELFLDVCHAIQHAHQKGIIHRDLKPSNVLVEIHDVRPVVKVIDFGIAKATGQQLTDKTLYTGIAQLIGTPLYMSPEQAGLSSLDVDARSDVYSLGVLLYELLTGTTPFESETLKQAGYDEMRRMIREDEPPRPSTRLSTIQQARLSTIAERRGLEPRRLGQQLRGELDWIVMKALEKDRGRRYESASTFAADVQRYLEDEPVQACPPSAGYRFRKFARRNKAALITAGAVAAALLIGTAVSVWQAVEANAARNHETQARQEAEAHFQKALNAVKRMLMEVGDERVAAIPQMKETRRRLLDEALAFYTDLIASNPRHSQAYHERAVLYQVMGKWEQARDDFQKVIECDPDNAEALGGIAIILNELGNRDEIILPYLQRSLELQPTNPIAYARFAFFYENRGRKKEAAAAYRKAGELSPPGSVEAYSWLAKAALTGGDLRTARENYEKLFSVAPSNAEAHLGLGQVHSALDEYDQAVAAFTKGLECPRVPSWVLVTIYDSRGSLHTRQKKYAAALSDFDRAIELNPFQWHFYKRRGLVHFRLQHYEQALAEIAKAVELNPDDVSNLTWIPLREVASCPDEKFQTGFRALVEKTIEILKNKPDFDKGQGHAGNHNNLAWLLATWPGLKLRDPGLAVAHAKKAVELAPGSSAPWNTLGVAEYRSGAGAAWNTLGVAQYRNGDWKAAVEALMKSVQLRKGGDSFDFFFLAMAHWQLGEKDKARAWYDRAVAWMDKNRPEDRELKRFRAEAAALLGPAKAAETQKKKP